MCRLIGISLDELPMSSKSAHRARTMIELQAVPEIARQNVNKTKFQRTLARRYRSEQIWSYGRASTARTISSVRNVFGRERAPDGISANDGRCLPVQRMHPRCPICARSSHSNMDTSPDLARHQTEFYPDRLIRRQLPGDMPVAREKTRVKWLWSAKPHARAISARLDLVFSIMSRACSVRCDMTQRCGV